MTEREALVAENLGLVRASAKKLSGKGVEYEELYSAGCEGLVKAADRFDASLGYRFSTYAMPVILGEMKRIFRDGGTVKVSRSLRELWLKISRASAEFELKNGREPTVSEISQILGVEASLVSEALCASRIPMSLSAKDDEENSEYDIPTDSTEAEVTEKLTLRALIEELPFEDKELIKLRYFKEKTQSQTAKMLGMTQVQVSRREKKILLSLREKMLV